MTAGGLRVRWNEVVVGFRAAGARRVPPAPGSCRATEPATCGRAEAKKRGPAMGGDADPD